MIYFGVYYSKAISTFWIFCVKLTNKREKNNKLLYEQLYANKFNNLDEVNKCLERHQVYRLSQEEITDLNRFTISKTLNQ